MHQNDGGHHTCLPGVEYRQAGVVSSSLNPRIPAPESMCACKRDVYAYVCGGVVPSKVFSAALLLLWPLAAGTAALHFVFLGRCRSSLASPWLPLLRLISGD